MTSYTWATAQSGNWNTNADWTPNTNFPGSGGGDTALINATGAAYTITYNLASETLNALTVNSADATLAFAANDALKVNGAVSVQAGTIDLLNNGAGIAAGSLTTSAGSTINIGTGASLTFSSYTVGGLIDISGSASLGASSNHLTLNGTIEVTAGTGTINFSAITGSGTLEANGGTLNLAASLNTTTSNFAISNSTASIFDISTAIGSHAKIGTITFAGANGEFELGAGASDGNITFAIAGLNAGASKTSPTNVMDVAGSTVTISSTTVTNATSGSVTLSNGDVLNLTGIANAGSGGWVAETASDGSGGTDVFLASVCYAAGTRILTAAGERPVENLAPGDIVLTVSGDERVAHPVKWVGRRRINIAAHPRPQAVAPIRIQRDAFADGVPHSDLVVSPDHGILVDNTLICARQLINGTTIRQESGWTSVAYFHVELDTHAILLAEGLPAESYLDTGNRGFFANAGAPLDLHPDMTDRPTREAASCVPFVWDEAGVRPVWQRLARRAALIGPPVPVRETSSDPELCIVAKGRRLRPLHVENGAYLFSLPVGTTEVRVVSRAGSPADTRPWLEDRRCLGVYVERIVLRGGNEVLDVPMDHPALSQGWWSAEWSGTELRRWTNGDATLPLPASEGPAILEIHAGGSGMTYVIEDAQRRAA